MTDGEEGKCYCHSIFKDGSSEITSERYTAAWARMINLLEKSRDDADMPKGNDIALRNHRE